MVIWHIDDLKISHVDRKVIDKLLQQLHGEFSKEAPLSVTHGTKHNYLGMTLDFGLAGMQMLDN